MERQSATCQFNKITKNMLEKIFVGTFILPFYIISKAIQYMFLKPMFKFCYDYFIYPRKTNSEDIKEINECESIRFFDKPKFHKLELFGLGIITFPIKIIFNLAFGIYKLFTSLPSCYKRIERLILLRNQIDTGITFLNFRAFDIRNYERGNTKHKRVSYSNYMYRTKDQNGVGIGGNHFYFLKELSKFKRICHMISICFGIHTIKFLSKAKKMDGYEESYGSVNINGFVPGNHESKQKNDIEINNVRGKNNTVDVHFDGVINIYEGKSPIVAKENICAIGSEDIRKSTCEVKEKYAGINNEKVNKKVSGYVGISYEKPPIVDKSRICSVNSGGIVKNNFQDVTLRQDLKLRLDKSTIYAGGDVDFLVKNDCGRIDMSKEKIDVEADKIYMAEKNGYDEWMISLKEDNATQKYIEHPKINKSQISNNEMEKVAELSFELPEFKEKEPICLPIQSKDNICIQKSVGVYHNIEQERENKNDNLPNGVGLLDKKNLRNEICIDSVGFVPEPKNSSTKKFSFMSIFSRFKSRQNDYLVEKEEIPSLQGDDWRFMESISTR